MKTVANIMHIGQENAFAVLARTTQQVELGRTRNAKPKASPNMSATRDIWGTVSACAKPA
jgi:hypothetical protein